MRLPWARARERAAGAPVLAAAQAVRESPVVRLTDDD
jgi:hypothetical protein